MPDIYITVRNRVARTEGMPEIVCGNSDYTAVFDLDAEWEAYPVKTARMVWRDPDFGAYRFAEMLFEGSRVCLPPVYRVNQVWLGIYAGDIRTTAPVRIPCCACVSDGNAVHPDPPPDVYAQLLRYLERLLNMQICAGTVTELSSGSAGICGKPINEEGI